MDRARTILYFFMKGLFIYLKLLAHRMKKDEFLRHSATFDNAARNLAKNAFTPSFTNKIGIKFTYQ